ncbi:unnamed protein product [Rotaria socialis]|uniref:FACT complex subunit SSRP1 n=3 Tax=Rotaria socialis TaxID=392032 RepID=A0A820KG91_9BILA|nr:unnamed protein product [Rotaria socialis]CAF3427401.1 unnamed protein product [Rotaria socialis]CAF3494963.1 unnamed protein product [Rotaria socialis]CAF3505663.1 unnamed protein product [Rotaria socialis]CAF3656144.1 unnamed protein product [Rotaria socialis]
MAAMEFDEVYEEIRGVLNPGRLKLTSNSVIFKNVRTGKVETITKDDIENIKWAKRARGYGLKFITKNDTSLRYDGFKDTDLDRLKEFMTINFGKNVETQKMAVNGWNWGKVSFGAGNLAFEVDNKQAFEVPLKNVSNSNKGKSEITLQFHQPDDAKVSLMEIRFYVPPGDVDGDAVEDFHQNVMKGAAVLTAKAGDAICSLSDINCLVPRGRHELRFYPGFFDLHGKSYDYKIPYNQITRGFLLPHKDNRQMYFVLSLDPPVKHGQTRYQYIIFGFKKEEETTVELSLTPEAIQEKYGNNLHKEMQGPYHDIVSRLFRAITEQRITVPGSFTSKSGAKCVSCAYKASAGLLYPLERGFIYITKPPIYIHHDDVASCGFNRSNTATGRTCDFEIQLKSGGSHVFSNIEKEEAKPMSDFLSSKDLRIHAASNWDKKINYTVDKDRDIYLEHVQNEGQEREDDDDESDDEEEDEDFQGDEEDDDELEYDSNASIHSTEDEDEDGNKSPSSPKKRKKSESSSATSNKKQDDKKKTSGDTKKKSDNPKKKSDDSKKKSKPKESPKKKAPKSSEQVEDDSD